MSEDPTPEEKSGEEEPEPITITAPDLWGAVEQLFSHYYNGVLIRGALLLDVYDTEGERQFEFEVPDDTAPWDIRSLAAEAIHTVEKFDTAVTVLKLMDEMMAEEDEEEADGDE